MIDEYFSIYALMDHAAVVVVVVFLSSSMTIIGKERTEAIN